jgi:hypothetical protein
MSIQPSAPQNDAVVPVKPKPNSQSSMPTMKMYREYRAKNQVKAKTPNEAENPNEAKKLNEATHQKNETTLHKAYEFCELFANARKNYNPEDVYSCIDNEYLKKNELKEKSKREEKKQQDINAFRIDYMAKKTCGNHSNYTKCKDAVYEDYRRNPTLFIKK